MRDELHSAEAARYRALLEGDEVAFNQFVRDHQDRVFRIALRWLGSVEEARDVVARFLGANRRETIFVRNATEAINLVAWTWGLEHVAEGDEILIQGATWRVVRDLAT